MSTDRYYCKVCSLFIDNNKAQRLQHERGGKHIANQEKLRISAKERKQATANSEKELQDTLLEIERAAREDLANDELPVHGNAFMPPPTYIHASSGSISGVIAGHTRVETSVHNNDTNDDGNGIYEENGTFYMQGDVNIQRLQPGSLCELFVEDLDEWVPASLSLRHDMEIPNSDAVSTTFDVTYFPQAVEEAQESAPPGFAADVRPQNIRILCDPPSTIVLSAVEEQGEEEEEGADKGGKVEVEESTGLGKWESVVIESADERGKDEDNGTRKELHSEKNKNSKREYKGVSIQTSRTVQNDSLSAGDGKMTKFKKRRKKE